MAITIEATRSGLKADPSLITPPADALDEVHCANFALRYNHRHAYGVH